MALADDGVVQENGMLTRKQAVDFLGMNDTEFALRLIWDAEFPKAEGGSFRAAALQHEYHPAGPRLPRTAATEFQRQPRLGVPSRFGKRTHGRAKVRWDRKGAPRRFVDRWGVSRFRLKGKWPREADAVNA